MKFKQSLLTAINFDGTIVEHRYPFIGKIRPFTFEPMEALEKKGNRLILWNHCKGKKLEEAVKFCSSYGIEFYALTKTILKKNVSKVKVARY